MICKARLCFTNSTIDTCKCRSLYDFHFDIRSSMTDFFVPVNYGYIAKSVGYASLYVCFFIIILVHEGTHTKDIII